MDAEPERGLVSPPAYRKTLGTTPPPGMSFGIDFLENVGNTHNEKEPAFSYIL